MSLYADDIVIFANDSSELQSSLYVKFEYCQRWKLKVNIKTTKIMVFIKGGWLPQNLRFLYDGKEIEIVSKLNYLGTPAYIVYISTWVYGLLVCY